MSPAGVFTLVTGASSGIGRATAMTLSTSRSLILHGRDVEALEETRKACKEPSAHLVWPYDFAGRQERLQDELAGFFTEKQCKVAEFVHCAGNVKLLPARTLYHGSIIESLDVHFIAAAQIVTTLLKKRVNGDSLRGIVFISSIWSRFGEPNHSLYCAAKGALDGFMKALAVELAPAVRVNCVLPGAVKTRLSQRRFDDPELSREMREQYPLGLGDPSDIAETVAFLLSEKARWITGQEIFVDGGWSCH